MNAKKIVRTAIKDALKGCNETMARARKDAQIIKANKAEVIHVADMLLGFLGDNETNLDRPRTYLYVGTDWNSKPRINLSVYDAPGFKDDGLMISMNYLMNVGFECNKTQDYAEALNREYTFERADMVVKLDVHVKRDSATCRRVPIGEQTVTQVKYKIECD